MLFQELGIGVPFQWHAKDRAGKEEEGQKPTLPAISATRSCNNPTVIRRVRWRKKGKKDDGEEKARQMKKL